MLGWAAGIGLIFDRNVRQKIALMARALQQNLCGIRRGKQPFHCAGLCFTSPFSLRGKTADRFGLALKTNRDLKTVGAV